MSERDELLKDKRPDRSERKRIPLGKRDRISFRTEDGYHYHLINDKDGRLQKAIEGGYEHVESDKNLGDAAVGTAKKVGKYVSMPVGNGVTGYLMRIKQEWYDEDQKEKQKVVDASERAMKPNKAKNEYGEGLVTEKL
jgi:hypothetical protein